MPPSVSPDPALPSGQNIVPRAPYRLTNPDKGRHEDIELAGLDLLKRPYVQVSALREFLLSKSTSQPLSADISTELSQTLLIDTVKRHAPLGRNFRIARTAQYAVKDNNHSPVFPMPYLFLFLFFGLASLSHAQGLLLAKQRAWDKDSQATPIEYSAAEKFSTVYNIVTPLGQSKRISSGLIVKDINYRTLMVPDDLQSSADNDVFQTRIAEVQDIISKWPSTKSYLQPLLTSAQEATKKYSQGFIKVSGQWISKDDHLKKQEEARKSAELEEQKYRQEQLEKQREKLASERAQLNQRAKELEGSILSLENSLTELTRSASTSNDPSIPKGVEKKTFFLERKLPKASFENLYELGKYVLECSTSGESQCILVTNSISSLENRYVDVWIKRSFDIDVTLKNGSEERATVFVESDADQVEMLEAAAARRKSSQANLTTVSENLRQQKAELLTVKERLASLPAGETVVADPPR